MSVLCKIFLFFILFENIIFTIFDVPEFFGYWDEIFCLVVIVLSVALILKRKQKIFQKSYFAVIISLVLLVVCGLASNLLFEYASSVEAILRDVVNLIKFPITFVCIKYLDIDKKLDFSFSGFVLVFLKVVVLIVFLLGIVSLFVDIGLSQDEIRHGFKSFQFLFSHPTYLVSSSMMMLLLFNCKKEEKSFFVFEIMMLLIIILTLRTKAFAIVAAYVYLKLSKKISRRFKLFGWIVLGIIIFSVAYYKLAEYASFSNSPREALYKGSLQLLVECFPVGSGFATYGSYLSGKYGSSVYEFIEIPISYNSSILNVLGDAGFAYYIGQFGFIGLILLAVVLWMIYKICLKETSNKQMIDVFLVYIIITLTSESILMNLGVEWALVLAVLSNNEKQNNIELDKLKRRC